MPKQKLKGNNPKEEIMFTNIKSLNKRADGYGKKNDENKARGVMKTKHSEGRKQKSR